MSQSRPQPRREGGFTLMEVIIAVTLVSLLLGGVFGVVRLALNTLDRVDARMMRERRVASVEEIMKSELQGMMPVAADCASSGEGAAQRIAFFEGEPATMRFVSTFSLNERGRGLPRILELQVVPGDNLEGVRLILNEHLYTGSQSTGAFCMTNPGGDTPGPRFAPVAVGSGSFVLADKLAYCRFEFHQPLARSDAGPAWLPRWKKTVLPDAIRIDLAPLQARGSELNLQPLTVPLHLNRDALAGYDQAR